MKERVKSKIRQAIRYAHDCGAVEIVEELEEVLGLIRLQECRKSMEENSMEMYCGTCCPECKNAGIESHSAAQGHVMDHHHNSRLTNQGRRE